MNDLIVDLCGVLHDLEWWQSCDISEEAYRKSLSAFKKKWFKGDREQRLKEYIDEQIRVVRSQLYSLIGELPKDQEHDFRITCSTEEPRCIDCRYSEENGKSCSAEGCIGYSKFTPKEKGD